MRKAFYWLGWAILIALPIAFTVEIVMIQDLPHVQRWKWAVPAAAVLLIYFARNRDDVLHHHVTT